MKNLAILIMLLSAFVVKAQTGIQFFEGNFEAAKQQAAKENKLIFMDAYTVWCGPCKKMNNDVFPVKEVGDFFNRNFINIKVDMEKGEGPQLAKAYGVNAYPTLLFIDKEGKIVKLAKGMRGPDALIQLGKDALLPNPALVAQLEAKFASGDRSISFLKEYIKTKAVFGEDFSDAMQSFLNSLSTAEKLENQNAEFILDYSADLKSSAFQQVLNFEKYFRDTYPAKFEAKVNQLVNYAVNDAITDNNEAAMKEAIAFLKQTKLVDAAEKSAWYEVYFYGKTYRWNEYAKAAENYIAKYKKNDEKTLKEISWSFYMHIDNQSMLKKAEKWIEQAIKLQNNYENNLTHAYLLYKLKKYNEAEDAVEYAIILAGDNEKLKTNAGILKSEIHIKLGKNQ